MTNTLDIGHKRQRGVSFRLAVLTMILAPVTAYAQDTGAGSVTTLDAVTATATKTDKSAIETPAAITVIDRETIERFQPKSLDDAVKTVPGLEMSGGPRDTAEQPNIRGFSGERVVIKTDGVRKNFESGHRGRTFLEPSLLKQVDVLRGPSSVLYGTGAIGGVINMETVDADDMLEPGETVGAQVRTSFHTNNSQKVGSTIVYGTPTDNVDLLASLTRTSAGNYEDGTGADIPGSGDSILAGLFKAGLGTDDHNLKFNVQTYKNDHTIPAAANTNSTNFAFRVTNEKSASVAYNFAGLDDLVDLNATAYYSRTDIRELVLTGGNHQTTELDTTGFDLSNTARMGLASWADLALTGGIEVFKDEEVGTLNGAPRAQFPTADRLNESVFLQSEFTLFDDLTVTPSARYDSVELTAAGQPDKNEEKLSKQLALSYQVTPWLSAFGSYAEAFRAPSLTELFVGGTHFAFNQFVANPNLRPEFAENKEIGLALKTDGVFSAHDALRAKASVFRNDVDDLIELQVVGGAFGTSTNQNVTNARIEGFEMETGYDSATVFATLGYAHIRGDDISTNTPLASIPEDKVSLTAGYRWTDAGVEAGWRSVYYAGQDRVPTGTQAVPGSKTIHDIFVSWVPDEEDIEGLRLDFGIDNVFDKDYQRFLSSLRESGRNVKFSASYKF